MTILLYILGGIATIVILFFLAVFISVVRTHRRWDRELKEACDSLRPLSSSHRCDPVRNSGRNGYSRMNSKHILLTIAWGIGILIGVIGYYYPIFTTQSLVKQEVKTLCSHGEPGDAVDYWDVPLQYQAEETEDQTALVCVVTSAGRDNEFDTDDDIIKEDVNLNKSKLIGRWAGQKFRQRMSQSRKGSTRSPETMKKIVATKRANGAYIVSDETREKIRQARLGKKLSPETIAKRTATWEKTITRNNSKENSNLEKEQSRKIEKTRGKHEKNRGH